VVITTIAVGLPAYWIISTELDKQAWARIEDAEHSVRVSLDAEQGRLDNIALLAAQRPNLRQLIQDRDVAALSDYLQSFQVDPLLDAIAVYDTSGYLIAQDRNSVFGPTLPSLTSSHLDVFPSEKIELAFIASQPIYNNSSEDLLGYVVVGIRLDDLYFRQLATETGFDLSILVDGIRIASSLESISPMAEDWPTIGQALESRPSLKTERVIDGKQYYSMLILPAIHRIGPGRWS
jgi:hypothetical protein